MHPASHFTKLQDAEIKDSPMTRNFTETNTPLQVFIMAFSGEEL